jgi:tryptophan synthase alpha chain
MSRIAAAFAALRAAGRPGLVTYVTAGDPDLRRSAAILTTLDRAGADLLEVGVPFSDPLADGPVIQRASERALAGGTTLARTLEMVAGVRAEVAAPIVLFTYVNPVCRMGLPAFVRVAKEAGVDGVLVLDLPLEEAGDVRERLLAAGIDTIFLLSPTTTPARIREAGRLGRGFLYGISRLGVTGAREAVSDEAPALARRVRAETTLPLALGFGISRPEHVRQIAAWAEAAVVGSALVDVVARHADRPDLLDRVGGYVRWLKGEAPGDDRP